MAHLINEREVGQMIRYMTTYKNVEFSVSLEDSGLNIKARVRRDDIGFHIGVYASAFMWWYEINEGEWQKQIHTMVASILERG